MADNRIKTACGVTVKLWHGDDCDGCKRIKHLIVRGDSPLEKGERVRRDKDGATFTLDHWGIDPDIGSGWFCDQGAFISDEAIASPAWSVLPPLATGGVVDPGKLYMVGEDGPVDVTPFAPTRHVGHVNIATPEDKLVDLMGELERSIKDAKAPRKRRRAEACAGLVPCPSGCGCVTAEDPDQRDCACDGPCCMAERWPIRAAAEDPS